MTNSPFAENITELLYPLVSLFYNTWAKIVLGLLWIGSWDISIETSLFETPDLLAEGLIYLVLLDFTAGNYRALTHKSIRWTFVAWKKTAYKFGIYTLVITGVTIGANMFGGVFAYTQLGTFAILSGIEIYSLFRHAGLTAIFTVLYDGIVKKKFGIEYDIRDIKEQIRKQAEEDFKTKQNR